MVAVRLLLHSSKRLARVVDLSLSMRRILVITTPRLFKNGASDSLRQATYCLSFCCCDNSLNKLLVFVGRVNFHFFIIQRHRIFLWVSRYFRVRRQFVTVAYPILAVSTSTLCALGCTIWSIASWLRGANSRKLSNCVLSTGKSELGPSLPLHRVGCTFIVCLYRCCECVVNHWRRLGRSYVID